MTPMPNRMEGSLPASDTEYDESMDFAAESMTDSGDEAFRITGPAEETDRLGEIADPVWGAADSHTPGTIPLWGTRPNPRGRHRAQVVVLLPALNEGPAIGAVMDRIPVDRMRTRGYDVRVWVVDGQSTDTTMDIARARGASTFVQSGTGKGNALQRFGLVAEGFDLEADLFASACERGIRMRELPIAYDRRIGEPKLVPLRTGLSIAWRLIMRRLNRPSTELRRIPPAAARRAETA